MSAIAGLAKSALESLAMKLGCRLIPEWRLEQWPLATHLRTLFELYGVDVVLDVGANRGQYYQFLRDEVGFRGHVISFEPIPEHADHLHTQSTSDPLWHIHSCALGRSVGRLTLNVMKVDQFSSFRTPDPQQVPRFSAMNAVASTVEVDVRTLDQLWGEISMVHGVHRPYLKMDTQGFDLEVIAGASTIHRRICALQSEVSVKTLYADAPSYIDALTEFQSMGFEISGFFSVARDPASRVIEFDAVMVQASSLPQARSS